MRKRTGLRNRCRSGRSTYSVQHKARSADRYSAMRDGRPVGADSIAGHALLAIHPNTTLYGVKARDIK